MTFNSLWGARPPGCAFWGLGIWGSGRGVLGGCGEVMDGLQQLVVRDAGSDGRGGGGGGVTNRGAVIGSASAKEVVLPGGTLAVGRGGGGGGEKSVKVDQGVTMQKVSIPQPASVSDHHEEALAGWGILV